MLLKSENTAIRWSCGRGWNVESLFSYRLALLFSLVHFIISSERKWYVDAYLKELTQSLCIWGVAGKNERARWSQEENFDVFLVVELQVDVFDVWAELSLVSQTVKLRAHTWNTAQEIYYQSVLEIHSQYGQHAVFTFLQNHVAIIIIR